MTSSFGGTTQVGQKEDSEGEDSQTRPQPVSIPQDEGSSDPSRLPADPFLECGVDFFLARIDRIKQIVLEVSSEMDNRQQLHELFLEGIESRITAMLHDLDELKHWSLGNDGSIESRRIHLEKELLQLEREKRVNALACWRDLLSLKTELRDALSEYKTLMDFKEVVF